MRLHEDIEDESIILQAGEEGGSQEYEGEEEEEHDLLQEVEHLVHLPHLRPKKGTCFNIVCFKE